MRYSQERKNKQQNTQALHTSILILNKVHQLFITHCYYTSTYCVDESDIQQKLQSFDGSLELSYSSCIPDHKRLQIM